MNWNVLGCFVCNVKTGNNSNIHQQGSDYIYYGTPIQRNFILLFKKIECNRFLYADMRRSPDQKASQLVKYGTCEPIKLHGQKTGKISTKLLTLVSLRERWRVTFTSAISI